jgi:hypothetical protein
MLLLGNIQFQNWEIPDELNLGGKQTLAIHKPIGNQRVIDAMGADPDDIRWSGRFQGGDAVGRAGQLEAMRDAAAPVTLVCGSIVKTVVISEFTYRYQREYQALYSICCVVVPDQDVAAPASLDDLVSADLASLSAQVDQFTANMDAVQAAMAPLPL